MEIIPLPEFLARPVITDKPIALFLIETKSSPSSIIKNHLLKVLGVEGIEILENGKPAFRNSQWSFNLAHSGDYTAVAFSQFFEIGIDLEVWKPKSRLLPIIERYFHSEEIKELASIQDDLKWESCALHLWTLKEALVKLNGSTLFQGLKSRLQHEKEFHFELEGKFSLTMVSTPKKV